MRFLRTLLWVVAAVFLAIIAWDNWSDVTLNLWGALQVDIKLPVLILLSFLLGFLPTWSILRGRIWQLKRRLAVQTGAAPVTVNPPAVEPASSRGFDPA